MSIKFSLVLPGRHIAPHIAECLEEQPARSGAYNWLFAHRGEINTFESIKDDLERYDVLQVNMAPVDMPIIPEIRRALGTSSSTKLVINNDYVCEKWNQWGLDPLYYRQIQRNGDMVFGTEEHQVSFMIEGAFCMPHPSNTKVLKRYGRDKSMAENSVACIHHWWDPQTYLSYLTLDKVKRKYGITKSRLFGYGKENMDNMARYREQMFDDIVPLLEFSEFADYIQRARVVFDPNGCHTYGRNGVELACWKRPAVGSKRVFSYGKLFPEMSCEPYDQKDIMKSFDYVLNKKNKKLVEEDLEHAYQEVEYFNYKNSVDRYMAALEKAERRGGYDFYRKQH